MAFPDGLAGVWSQKIVPWWQRKQAARLQTRAQIAAAQASYPLPPAPPRPSPPADLPSGISGQRA
jgi:urea transport system permease protein